MAEIQNGVLYIEPNYNEDAEKRIGTRFYQRDLEDYCIYVDLEVEVYDRQIEAGVKGATTTYLLSWMTHSDGRTSASFHQGKRTKYGDDMTNTFNILSTDYTNTFYEDIFLDNTTEQSNNTEMFGIESINISYNNFTVPQVEIKFTDIKGTSLFAPEELRHHKTRDGVGGFSDKDIAGSFFKCFFTMPYPKFTLHVKGFYGQPVAYELCCSKFKANFDSKTGNFGAVANFVGYMFTSLNDVSLDAVIAAPLDMYIGQRYWTDTVLHNDAYKLTNSKNELVNPITFNELIIKMNELKKHSNELKSENKDIYDKQGQVNTVIEELQKLKNTYNDCFNSVISSFMQKDPSRCVSDDEYKAICFFCSDNDTVSGITEYNFQSVNTMLSELSNGSDGSYFGSINKLSKDLHKIDNVVTEDGNSIDNTNSEIASCSIIDKMGEVIKNNDKFDAKINKNCIFFDGAVFISQFNKTLENVQKIKTEVDKRITEIQTHAMVDALGFNPTIKNFMKITMAHFETLYKIIYTAASNVEKNNSSPTGKRFLKDFGFESAEYTGLKLIEGEVVPPWPKVLVKRSDNDETLVDGWIGDFPSNSIMQPEAQAVEGLISGIINFSKTCAEAQQIEEELTKQEQETENSTFTSNVVLPLISLDFVLNGNPFGTNELSREEDSVIDDILSRMFMRGTNVLFSYIMSNNDLDDYGRFDAINFFKKYGNQLSDITKNKIKGLDYNEVLKHMTEDIDGVNGNTPFWRYNGNNNVEQSPLFGQEKRSNYPYFRKSNEFPLINSSINDAINGYNSKNENYASQDVDCQNSIFFFENDKFKKYDNINVEASCLKIGEKDYYNDYEKLVKDEIISNFKYDKDKVFKNGSTRTFTNDYDGLFSKEYIDKTYTFGCKLKRNSDKEYHDYSLEDIDEDKWNRCGIITNKKGYSIFPIKKEAVDDVDKFYSREEFNVNKMIEHDGMGEDSITQDYTIPHIQYYDTNTSLFFTDAYYVSSIEERAFLFLDNLRYHDVNNVINELIENAHHKGKEPFYTTKVGALLVGAYIYRYDNFDRFLNNAKATKDGEKLSSSKINQLVWSNKELQNEFFWNKYDTKKIELKSPWTVEKLKQIRRKFKKYFVDWINDDFKQINDILSLNYDASVHDNKDYLNNLRKKWITSTDLGFSVHCNMLLIDELKNIDKTEYYSRVQWNGNDGQVKLILRQNSDIARKLTKLYTQPLLIVLPKYYVTTSNGLINYGKNKLKLYISGFLEALKLIVDNQVENSEPTIGSIVSPTHTVTDIKISLYKYLKIIYDKWIGGTKFEQWTIDNFFNKNFHFVDSYYYDIGDKVMVNPSVWVQHLIQSQQNKDNSLISFLSSVLQKHNLSFVAVNNFFDLNTANNFVDRMNEMFEPISYLDMKKGDSRQHFVILYKGETSSKLDIEGSPIVNDSFMLNYDDEKHWPRAITSKNGTNGYPIPAFGVSYGGQYQSYFSDISVGLDSPITTDQGLQAQFNIASMNGKDTENSERSYCVGQDLYTVYANNSYSCKVTMMGCAWIQPLMYFVLNNVPLFRGSYLIQKVNHTITPGNMVTTFEGVRMANTLTPFVKDAILTETDDGNFSGSFPNSNKEKTSNDCEYIAFNVEKIDGGCDEETLLKSYAEYGYHNQGSKDNDSHRFDNKKYGGKILDALAQTIRNEAGAETNDFGKLQMQLVATVLYNRWCKNGRDFKKLFTVGQIKYDDTTNEPSDLNYQVARDIFTNTPAVIVGKQTKVYNPVTIYNHGMLSTERTKSVTITLDMLQKMYMYCTPKGYDISNPRPNGKGPTNSKGKQYLEANPNDWRKQLYLCHHDTSERYGHVFTTGDGDKSYWEYKTPTSTNGVGENGLSKISNGLVEAVQKTIDNSNVVKYKVTSKIINKNNPNLFIIESSVKEQAKTTYDILLSTYGDYCKSLYWVVNETNASSQDYPTSILVETQEKNDVNGTSIRVATTNSLNSPTITLTKDSVNSVFYRILSKKYKDNIELFKSDCKGQFGNQTDEEIKALLTDNSCVDCSLNGVPTSLSNQKHDDFSNLVTNSKMKLVLSDVCHLNSNTLGNNYKLLVQDRDAKPSQRCCTAGPSTWYSRGGLKMSSDGWWSPRKVNYVTYENSKQNLKNYGFTPVWHGKLSDIDKLSPSSTPFKLLPGDIATLYPGDVGDGKKHQHGLMWTGKDWRSDYVQTHANCYSKYGNKLGEYGAVIWRHKDFQEPNNLPLVEMNGA